MTYTETKVINEMTFREDGKVQVYRTGIMVADGTDPSEEDFERKRQPLRDSWDDCKPLEKAFVNERRQA